MKKLIRIVSIISLFFISFSCVSTRKSNMDFINATQINQNSEIAAVNLPTFMIKPFIVKTLKKENESKELIALIKNIKKVKILTIQNPNETIQHSFADYKIKNNIDELMVINNNGEKVSINAVQNEVNISRLLLQINSKEKENEVVFIDLKGKFKLEDLSKLIRQ